MTKIKLDIRNINTDTTVRYLVDSVTVINDTFIFRSNDNTHCYGLNNYEFTIKGSVELWKIN